MEWALHLLGGGGNLMREYEIDGRRTARDAVGTASDLLRLVAGNDWVGVAVETLVEPAADAWWSPMDDLQLRGGFQARLPGQRIALPIRSPRARRADHGCASSSASPRPATAPPELAPAGATAAGA